MPADGLHLPATVLTALAVRAVLARLVEAEAVEVLEGDPVRGDDRGQRRGRGRGAAPSAAAAARAAAVVAAEGAELVVEVHGAEGAVGASAWRRRG